MTHYRPIMQPANGGRSARRRARRRRTALVGILGIVVALVVAVAVWATGSPTRNPIPNSTSPTQHTNVKAAPAAESGLMPWSLGAPLSRSVVLAGANGQLIVVGGLDASQSSLATIWSVDPSTGKPTVIGSLPRGVHDGAGAVLGGRYFVFGGGSPATVADVEAFNVVAGATAAAQVVGSLPQPRSDEAALTLGQQIYIVGGYDGTSADPEVLATRDGAHFTNVASLPVPVRYPAVAAVGNKIYVFGGQSINAAAMPVDAIQVVDTSAKTARVVGHLAAPLSAAAAVVTDGRVYLAGGQSTMAENLVPGVGTTQLSTTPGTNQGAGATGSIPDAYVPAAGSGAAATLTATHSGASSTSGPLSTAAASTSTVSSIWNFDPTTDKLLLAGRLQVPVAHTGATVLGKIAYLFGGEEGSSLLTAAQMLEPNASFGVSGQPGAGSPYYGGQLLVADRGNNRLLLFDDTMHLVWTYPSPSAPTDPFDFYFPDDAFFVNHGKAIISNQEQNETIVEIAYPSGKIIWSYGHPKQTGTAPGYLHEPDDAYLLKNGQISVADAQNCRVLILNTDGTVAHQIGTNGRCVHNPPTSMGSPNGDTPLADGNLLVSEINGSWISEYTPDGQLVWTRHLAISYPSDPQQIGPDLYLVADYAKPGQLLEFTREGTITYRYQVTSGPGELNHPSLAELLPSGVIMINDDYANRMVAIDPATGALVWQYGVTNTAGTATGLLNTPDGFDLLLPDGSTPTHPATG